MAHHVKFVRQLLISVGGRYPIKEAVGETGRLCNPQLGINGFRLPENTLISKEDYTKLSHIVNIHGNPLNTNDTSKYIELSHKRVISACAALSTGDRNWAHHLINEEEF